jgi:hypothetical protein
VAVILTLLDKTKRILQDMLSDKRAWWLAAEGGGDAEADLEEAEADAAKATDERSKSDAEVAKRQKNIDQSNEEAARLEEELAAQRAAQLKRDQETADAQAKAGEIKDKAAADQQQGAKDKASLSEKIQGLSMQAEEQFAKNQATSLEQTEAEGKELKARAEETEDESAGGEGAEEGEEITSRADLAKAVAADAAKEVAKAAKPAIDAAKAGARAGAAAGRAGAKGASAVGRAGAKGGAAVAGTVEAGTGKVLGGLGAQGKKIMEDKGNAGGGAFQPSHPALAGITGIVALIATGIVYQAYGYDGARTIVPFILLLAGAVFIIVEKFRSILGWVLWVFAGAIWIYNAGGSIIAILPLFLFVAAVGWLLQTKDHRSGAAWAGIMCLFALSIFLFFSQTMPYAYASVQTAGGVKQVVAGSTTEAGQTATGGMNKFFDNIKTSIDVQKQIATGEHIEGDIDPQAAPGKVGIEMKDPLIDLNPKKPISEDQLRSLEISSRITGYDPKTPIEIAAVCHLQTQKENDDVKKSLEGEYGPNINPGAQQAMRPSLFSGHSIDKTPTCRPKIAGCGEYVVTISAEADYLRTDARMQNYVVDQVVLDEKLETHVVDKKLRVEGEGQLISAMYGAFEGDLGEPQSYKSKSGKGAIKVVMMTQHIPVIGVSGDTELIFRAGVENVLEGWINNVTRVELEIKPELFTPDPLFCDSWRKEGDVFVLDEEYLKTARFREVRPSRQKIFPSCHLQQSTFDMLYEPQEIQYSLSVEYDYLVQKEYKINVKATPGQKCSNAPEPKTEAKSGDTSTKDSTTKSA